MLKESEQESNNSENINLTQLIVKVTKALENLQFGEIIIKVQAGKVVWVDRYERERLDAS